MKIVSSFVREQKRYTKNELKNIFSFDDAGVEKFIKSLKAYGVLKSVKNSMAQMWQLLSNLPTMYRKKSPRGMRQNIRKKNQYN